MESWEGFPNKKFLPLRKTPTFGNATTVCFSVFFRLDLGDLFLWNVFCEVFNYLRVHFKMNTTPRKFEEKKTVLAYGDLLASIHVKFRACNI